MVNKIYYTQQAGIFPGHLFNPGINRWGQKVFTTVNPLQGWNGMHGASLADIGVYYYHMQYKYKGETGGRYYPGEIV